jgi:hypothetical protein
MSFSEARHKRVRRLVHVLNKERKRQAKKIDILCNDFIAGLRSFINKLDVIAFAADFYESIVGIIELEALLAKTSSRIRNLVSDTNIVFFFRHESGFEKHIFDNPAEPFPDIDSREFPEAITDEVAESICCLNKVCTLSELPSVGLQSNPALLNKLTAVTIPLGQMGPSVGFILLYRFGDNQISCREINKVCSITTGLSQAIRSCQMLQH